MEDKDINNDLADAIIERPHTFTVAGRHFKIYPVTLGKKYLLSRLVDGLDINNETLNANPCLEILRVCKQKRDCVIRIIVYHTINTKRELFDEDVIDKRMSFFDENLSDEDLTQLMLIVTFGDNVDRFIKHLGIDKENEFKSKVSKFKNETSNTISFGGKSIYGSLLDFACQRYGWTYEYVIWGISYVNLRMLMSDQVSTQYLTKEEQRKLHIPKDRTVINADDKEELKKYIKYFKD